jgi:hypothetical protein
MTTIGRTTLLLLIVTLLVGCAPLTPEQIADIEARDRERETECGRRGGVYVSGSCVSRGGGA